MKASETRTDWKRVAMEATPKAAAEFLIPPASTVETGGLGTPFELGRLAGLELLIVLRVEHVIEQESLAVSIWGSEDGRGWGEKPLFRFPEVFYQGIKPAALNLIEQPGLKFLQARWEVNRWGRASPRPFFKFSVTVEELS